jgi:hypothetical protein
MFNIKHKNALDTYISLDEIEVNGKKTSAMLGVNEHTKNYKFKIENGLPVYCIDLTFYCKFEDANMLVGVSDLNPTAEIPKEVLKTAEDKITQTLNSLFNKLKKSKCDLFQVEDSLYQKFFSHYDKLSGLTLEKLQLKTTVKCQSEKSTRL